MSKTIKAEDLSKEIQKYLNEYREDIQDDVEEISTKIAKEAKDELKEKSPKRTGKYSKGWTVKQGDRKTYRFTKKIWNKTDYQLTHLLEFGHATRNGGRTEPIPHIRPVEEEYSKIFKEELENKIRRNK